MLFITKKKRRTWQCIKQIYPYKKLTKKLYLVRVWSRQKHKISPWIFIILLMDDIDK